MTDMSEILHARCEENMEVTGHHTAGGVVAIEELGVFILGVFRLLQCA